jgi:hypothetical protein
MKVMTERKCNDKSHFFKANSELNFARNLMSSFLAGSIQLVTQISTIYHCNISCNFRNYSSIPIFSAPIFSARHKNPFSKCQNSANVTGYPMHNSDIFSPKQLKILELNCIIENMTNFYQLFPITDFQNFKISQI